MNFFLILLIIIFYYLFFTIKEKFSDEESLYNLNSILNSNIFLTKNDVNITNEIVINGNFDSCENFIITKKINLIPEKMIVPFYGDTIPPGWVECDGTNGTPDLRGRFIMGKLNDTQALYDGAEKVTLTVNQLPKHKHGYKSAAVNWWADNCCWQIHTFNRYEGGTTGNAGGSNGVTQPHNNVPPYYVLKYIMKKDL